MRSPVRRLLPSRRNRYYGPVVTCLLGLQKINETSSGSFIFWEEEVCAVPTSEIRFYERSTNQNSALKACRNVFQSMNEPTKGESGQK
ncbi:hypothetical protein GWI33_013353 [Rhynchophorus ferrugineus]|uniref:Uncharacterized protein n=1 Tax=Rhynchophorus ferrugineus TaxID=354439 RepID=A0A834MDB2_RHYFE|nr:hypothetical protein GWI33_013353 [Rhynchophorus ferrugineus]